MTLIKDLLENQDPRQSTHMTPQDKQQLMKLLNRAFWAHSNTESVRHEPGDAERLDFRGIIDTMEEILPEIPEGETYDPANPRLVSR
jgi:hypothetical protein